MTRLFLVHGFGFDPEDPDHDPNLDLYPRWDAMAHRDTIPFAWYSVPPGIRHVLRSWRRGHWNRYYYAWKLAEEAGARLCRSLERGGLADIICHSLGSRVVLCALERCMARRVLIFNGADECDHARQVAAMRPGVQFYNVMVKSDDVLDLLGEWFSPRLGHAAVIGAKGLKGLGNWTDIPLDDKKFIAKARDHGYRLRGDNPKEIGDHRESYDWEPNWKLWRDLLDGTCRMAL